MVRLKKEIVSLLIVSLELKNALLIALAYSLNF